MKIQFSVFNEIKPLGNKIRCGFFRKNRDIKESIIILNTIQRIIF